LGAYRSGSSSVGASQITQALDRLRRAPRFGEHYQPLEQIRGVLETQN
jgi:hypothetical protein